MQLKLNKDDEITIKMSDDNVYTIKDEKGKVKITRNSFAIEMVVEKPTYNVVLIK